MYRSRRAAALLAATSENECIFENVLFSSNVEDHMLNESFNGDMSDSSRIVFLRFTVMSCLSTEFLDLSLSDN